MKTITFALCLPAVIALALLSIACEWRRPVNLHPELNPPGATVDADGFPVSWPTPECVGSGCKPQ